MTPWKLWRRGGELLLTEGSHSIGRGLDCPILIESLGASRLHAKLHASADMLTIEDAGSTNGTYVNGQRVRLSRDLEHGDRILIGNAEFVVLHALKATRDSLSPVMSLGPISSEPGWRSPPAPEARTGPAPQRGAATEDPPAATPTPGPVAVTQEPPGRGGSPQRTAPTQDPPAPPPAAQRLAPTRNRLPFAQPAAVTQEPPVERPPSPPRLRRDAETKDASELSNCPDTQQLDAIATLGRLADRMLVMGRIDAASRILGGHLRGVREAVERGEKIAPRALQDANAYAFKMAHATRSGSWIDIVVGIYLAQRKMLEPEFVRQIAQCVSGGMALDRRLFDEYRAAVNDLMNEGDEFDRMVGDMILAIELGN